ncbi:MAG TPA: hypothetical protein PKC20_07000 [Burkholderiaceae bacterium]|nr:hypothetical protein [Burkholderiaceae bacterium]
MQDENRQALFDRLVRGLTDELQGEDPWPNFLIRNKAFPLIARVGSDATILRADWFVKTA